MFNFNDAFGYMCLNSSYLENVLSVFLTDRTDFEINKMFELFSLFLIYCTIGKGLYRERTCMTLGRQ